MNVGDGLNLRKDIIKLPTCKLCNSPPEVLLSNLSNFTVVSSAVL